MTDEKLLAAAGKVRDVLVKWRGEPRRCDAGATFTAGLPHTADMAAAGDHAMWMCGMIPRFVEVGARGKAMRWLGFVQGVIWTLGMVSIDELRNFNEE